MPFYNSCADVADTYSIYTPGDMNNTRAHELLSIVPISHARHDWICIAEHWNVINED